MNRCRLARKNAGLSVGQAARLIGIAPEKLRAMEDPAAPVCFAEKLADVYGVNVEWLSGTVDQRDHAALKSIPGADALPFHDRDVIAEVMASRPRRGSPKP